MVSSSKSLEKIKLHLFPLSFAGEFEIAFQEYYFHDALLHIRMALVVGLFFYLIFGLLDVWLVPDAKHKLWFIRYAVILPYVSATFLFSFSRHFKKFGQLATASSVLVAGLGISAMIVIAPYPASYSYYAGLLLVFIYGYTFLKLRFVWASVTMWVIVIAYEIAAIWLSSTPLPTLLNNNFFFLSGNLLGMFACYSIEFYSRRDFMQAHLLKAERKKVTAINMELENRVEERTAQLLNINRELTQEISERKRAEKERRYLETQLRKSQKMEAIGTLAGGVAHDLNNILSGLVSYPELLLMDLSDGSPLKQPLLTIQESGQKAAAIVQDLLTLARRGVSVTEVMNLNHLIEQYLKSPENYKILEYNSDVMVTVCLQDDLLNIMGSPVHLSKTIMNLVSNAVEAMPNGGAVRIATANVYIDKSINGFEAVKEGDYVTLTVCDTGIGISPQDIERIFEPFYTKKTMGRSGTGLGMAVVWGTVKDHDGYIDVKSKLDEGTTFTLYFPVTHEAIPLEKPRISPEIYKGNGESILIVDDIKEQREIASEILKKLGYNVISVPSGEEAVRYLQKNEADLLLLDMIMNPGMNGLETFKQVLLYRPTQKAVIASGFSESNLVKEARDIGVGTYLKKPYTFEKIGMAVKDVLTGQAAG